MQSAPLARSQDLSRLLDDGYDVVLEGGHIVIRHIPYVDHEMSVQYGFLAYPVTVSGDRIVSGTDHRLWFGGTHPYSAQNKPLLLANPEARHVAENLTAQFMLSSKPMEGYPDEYTKITTYVRILEHEARAIDPTVTATPGGSWQVGDDAGPFVYRDTATSRAGLAEVSRCFIGQHIAIVGLGGTGAYILDQVAKTPVETISLIDGDLFENHNAFRAPGAAPFEVLKGRPKKVDYFKDLYSHMHTGIVAHSVFLDEGNLPLLDAATFVFLATDDAASKAAIIARLETLDIPFIDVGMGIEEVDGRLTGLTRVTASLPGQRNHVHEKKRIPAPAPQADVYGRNIQIADLNALNALQAVIRWKRYLGFYADGVSEGFTTYSIYTNEISNEDLL
jgi:hypothetical protein